MTLQTLIRKNKPDLAYIKTEGQAPTVIFLPGYKSDMEGTKATYLESRCKDKGQGFLRFDYAGHGVSGGDFKDGTIGSWTQDALDMIDSVTDGDLILIGSSMGGWIALLAALKRPERVKGLIGIAAAPDFTEGLYTREFNDEQRQTIDEQGFIEIPNEYSDEPYIFTKALIEDGRDHLLLEKGIDLCIPVRLIQGMKDADVEWQTAHRIKNAIEETAAQPDCDVLLIEDGDHRLSRPQDLDMIEKKLEELTYACI